MIVRDTTISTVLPGRVPAYDVTGVVGKSIPKRPLCTTTVRFKNVRRPPCPGNPENSRDVQRPASCISGLSGKRTLGWHDLSRGIYTLFPKREIFAITSESLEKCLGNFKDLKRTFQRRILCFNHMGLPPLIHFSDVPISASKSKQVIVKK